MLSAYLKRLDTWVSRIANWTGVAGLFGGGAVLTAVFSFAASGWNAIASQGWGAMVFAGAFMAAFLMLIGTGSLALFRYFRPLPALPMPIPVQAVVAPAIPEPIPLVEIKEWMPPTWALDEFGHIGLRKEKESLEAKMKEAYVRLEPASPEEYSQIREEIQDLERKKQRASWNIMWSVVHQLQDGELIAEGFADPGDKAPVRINAVEWRKYLLDEKEFALKRVMLGTIVYTGVMIGKPDTDDDIPF